MADAFIRYGQSNQVFINLDTGAATTQALNVVWQPIIQALVDPAAGASAPSNLFGIGTVGGALGSAIGGIGLIHRNSSGSPLLALQGDGYHGVVGGEHWVRPAPPSNAALFDNWATWPLTSAGINVSDWAAALTAPQKAEVRGIGVLLNEYDVAGYSTQSPWARDDPRVWAYACMRMITEFRTQVGKTAAQAPCTLMAPIPYSSGGNQGYELVWQAMNIVARRGDMHTSIVVGNCMDIVLDRNDGAGGDDGNYRFHMNGADQLYLARKIAYGEARARGRDLNSAAFLWAGYGPEIVAAQRIDDTTVDVWVRHDGGNALTLPATATRGWRVEYAGREVTVSAAAVQSGGRVVRLTLATACPIAEAITVHYGWGSARLIEGGTGSHGTGGIYDDAGSWDAKAIPAAITGASRVNMILRRTQPGGFRASSAAPAARLLLPV